MGKGDVRRPRSPNTTPQQYADNWDSIFNRYRAVDTSSEEFAERKQEEIDIEDGNTADGPPQDTSGDSDEEHVERGED